MLIFYLGTYSPELHKTVYLQNRRYLPDYHELRGDAKCFSTKAIEPRPIPKKQNCDILNHSHQAYDAVKSR